MLAYGIACAVQSPERVWELVLDGASRLVPGKSEGWLRQKLSAVMARVERHLAGERVFWDEREWSPIYTPRIEWFLDLLSISREDMEQAGLVVLVDRAVRRRLERAERRKDGKREQSRAATEKAVMEAVGRLGEGASDKEVADAVGCSASTVNRIRNRRSEDGANICTKAGTTERKPSREQDLITGSVETDGDKEVENGIHTGEAEPARGEASPARILTSLPKAGPKKDTVVPFRPRKAKTPPRVPLPPPDMPSSFAARLRCIRYAILYGYLKEGMEVEELVQLHGWPAATVRALISGELAQAS